jgi:hypothetical protein
MNRSLRHAVFLAGLGAVPGLAPAASPLAPSSPFLPADAAQAAGAAEATPLELRGILADAGGYRFSIYDPARHTGQWVRLNEPGHDFTVRTHDVARDTVTLDYQGRVLTLPLRTAKVTGLASAEPASGLASGPRPTPGPAGAGPVPRPPTPEETARYNRAVEEIARRRALREKGPGPMPMPGPTSGPMPVPGPTPK